MAESLEVEGGGKEAAALPAKWSESVYLIPSSTNKYLTELISKAVPDGCQAIQEFALSDSQDSPTASHQNPFFCVKGSFHYVLGTDLRDTDALHGEKYVLILRDTTSNIQLRFIVSGSVAHSFPNPTNTELCIISPKLIPNISYETQSQDVPVSFVLDDDTKGCVVVIDKLLYNRFKDKKEAVNSLLFVLKTTPAERIALNTKASTNQTPISSTADNNLSSTPNRKSTSNKRRPSSVLSTGAKKPNSAPDTSAPVYTYTELGSLVPDTLKKINIAGMVTWVKDPSRSKKGDSYISFRVSDPSISGSDVAGIAFNHDISKLPRIIQEGDIILLRHVKINDYNNSNQICAYKFSSHHVFTSDSLTPTDSSQSTGLTQSDIDVVKRLQKWAGHGGGVVEKDMSGPTKKKQELPSLYSAVKTFNSVGQGDVFEIVGLVCSVGILVKNTIGVVRVADGTTPTFVTAAHNESQDNQYCHQYGRFAVTVFIEDPSIVKSLNSISNGSFVHLKNLHAVPEKVSFGDKVGAFGNAVGVSDDAVGVSTGTECVRFCIKGHSNHSVSCLTVLSDMDIINVVKKRLQLTSPVPVKSPCIRIAVSSVTHNCHNDLPFSTTADVLGSRRVPNVFRLRAVPTRIREHRVEDISHLYCKKCVSTYAMPTSEVESRNGVFARSGDRCTRCSTGILEYGFVFSVTLVDPDDTAPIELTVTAVNNHALGLLPGIKPCNLFMKDESRRTVLGRLMTLFGFDPFAKENRTASNETLRARGNAIDCSVYSFKDSNGAGQSTHVYYRFYDTILNI